MIHTSNKLFLNNSPDTLESRIQESPQYRDGKFRSANPPMKISWSEYPGMIKDHIFAKNERSPSDQLPTQAVDLSHFKQSAEGVMNASWVGHSSLLINVDGYKILTDPVYEKRVSIFGPTRYNGEVPLDIDALPEVDVVIVSHNHYDHLNRSSIEALADKTKWFLTPLGAGKLLQKWGVAANKIIQMDWWEEFSFDSNLKITATPSQHFSGRGLTDTDKTLWASWVIKTPGHSLFFSGDSGYFEGFKEIGDRHGPFDMTFIECGAYDKSWETIHMFPEQTVQAHIDLKGKILHPIHWGTFNLAQHPWYEPMDRLLARATETEVQLALPIVGETTILGEFVPTHPWWKDSRRESATSKHSIHLDKTANMKL